MAANNADIFTKINPDRVLNASGRAKIPYRTTPKPYVRGTTPPTPTTTEAKPIVPDDELHGDYLDELPPLAENVIAPLEISSPVVAPPSPAVSVLTNTSNVQRQISIEKKILKKDSGDAQGNKDAVTKITLARREADQRVPESFSDIDGLDESVDNSSLTSKEDGDFESWAHSKPAPLETNPKPGVLSDTTVVNEKQETALVEVDLLNDIPLSVKTGLVQPFEMDPFRDIDIFFPDASRTESHATSKISPQESTVSIVVDNRNGTMRSENHVSLTLTNYISKNCASTPVTLTTPFYSCTSDFHVLSGNAGLLMFSSSPHFFNFMTCHLSKKAQAVVVPSKKHWCDCIWSNGPAFTDEHEDHDVLVGLVTLSPDHDLNCLKIKRLSKTLVAKDNTGEPVLMNITLHLQIDPASLPNDLRTLDTSNVALLTIERTV